MEVEPQDLETPLAQTLLGEDATEIEAGEELGHKDVRIHVASQWQLIWWRFRRHKLALFSLIVLIIIYLIVLFAEFIAPYDPGDYSARYTYAPPQVLHLFDDRVVSIPTSTTTRSKLIRRRCAAPSSSTRTSKSRCASSCIAGPINCSASSRPTSI